MKRNMGKSHSLRQLFSRRQLRRQRRRLGLESLEIRTVLDGSGLTLTDNVEVRDRGEDNAGQQEIVVSGTTGDDDISIKIEEVEGVDNIVIEMNGGSISQPVGNITHVVVNGDDGNDLIRVQDSVYLTTELNGDGGNDEITSNGTAEACIHGGAGSDILIGTDVGDKIDGGAGNDFIRARGGDDSVQGGIGNDTISGGRGNDTLNGDPADIVPLPEPVDPIDFDVAVALQNAVAVEDIRSVDEIDTIPRPHFNDVIYGGAGDDEIGGQLGSDILIGNGGQDTINGGSGNDAMDGGSGNDTINGGASFDVIFGGTGNDRLSGDGGNDVVVGGSGNDIVNGGNGHDWLFGDATNSFPTILAVAAAVEPVPGDFNGDGETNADDLNVVLFNWNRDSVADGWVAQLPTSSVGSDHLNQVIFNWGRRAVAVDPQPGDNPYVDPVKYAIDFANVNTGRDTINGGDGNDVILAGNADDTVDAGAGHDYVQGGYGNDAVDGGDGTDSILGDSLLVNDPGLPRPLPTDITTLDEDLRMTDLVDPEILPLHGDDDLDGGGEGDRIHGQGGDDWVHGGAGNDTLVGGAGDDTISGSTGNDELLGLAGNDYLIGGSGNDSLYGDGGNDWLIGDGGNRHPEMDFDPIAYAIRFTNLNRGSDTLAGGSGLDILLAGNADDTIDGGDGFDYAQGGYGADVINGGADHDELFGDSILVNDPPVRVLEVDKYAIDEHLVSMDEATAKVDIHPDELSPETLPPIPQPNHDDVINGGGGDDWLFGQLGNDMLDGQGANDGVHGGDGDDWVHGGSGNDILTGDAGDDVVTGGAGNDALFGNAGNDYLIGGSGHDGLAGDGGNDWLIGDGGNRHPEMGFDFVEYAIRFTNVNRGNDILLGGASHDILLGGNGDDHIVGGRGNDYAQGGYGNDAIFGGNDDGVDVAQSDETGVVITDNDVLLGDSLRVNDPPLPDPMPTDVVAINDHLRIEDEADAMLGMDAEELENDVSGVSGVDGKILPPDLRPNADSISGGRGGDWIFGQQGNDNLSGGSGGDVIRGGTGNDVMHGDAGNDEMNGGNGFDSVSGDAGNDSVTGGLGTDNLVGGDGADRIDAQDGVIDFICADEMDEVLDDPMDLWYCLPRPE